MDVSPPWLEEVDPVAGPPFLRMGTRALGTGWLVDGPDVAGMLAAKAEVLAMHHEEAVAALPGTDDAVAEVLALVLAELGTESAANQDLRCQVHPIEAAGLLVAEDLCLLVPDETGRWILGAASLCFPSHWRLHDKLGRSVAAIHAPVPAYDVMLEARVDRFLDRLRVGAPVWRRNWTVHHSPALFAPDVPPPPEPPVTVGDAAERLWLRSEYQTLQRLPQTGTILFGIRTQQVPWVRCATGPTSPPASPTPPRRGADRSSPTAAAKRSAYPSSRGSAPPVRVREGRIEEVTSARVAMLCCWVGPAVELRRGRQIADGWAATNALLAGPLDFERARSRRVGR